MDALPHRMLADLRKFLKRNGDRACRNGKASVRVLSCGKGNIEVRRRRSGKVDASCSDAGSCEIGFGHGIPCGPAIRSEPGSVELAFGQGLICGKDVARMRRLGNEQCRLVRIRCVREDARD